MSSYVTTASVFVDGVDSPEEADAIVQHINALAANDQLGRKRIHIRLPDESAPHDSWDMVS